jgi:hypothetical protein
MDTTRAARPIPLFLTALVAFFAALAALAVANGHGAMAHGGGHDAAPTASVSSPAVMPRKEVALREDMRRLWEDHVTWTRLAIISLTTDSPDTEATVARLLRNQDDIGAAVAPFYGDAAGDELARQLRQHIVVAADLVAAARAGDAAALADAQARWERNADDLAGVLSSVNPRHWTRADMRRELGMHLQLTTDEAVARLQGDWDADVAAYDRIHAHALHFSDLLSTGLVKQFPKRFR